MTSPNSFSEAGFLGLSSSIREGILADNDDWLQLARDTNTILMRIIMTGIEADAAHGLNWSKEAIALRLLMRSGSSFQGVVLLVELGMATQARMLVRSIVEDSFFAAALLEKPDEVIRMLRADSEASRRANAKLILQQQLGGDPAALEKLEASITKIDAEARFVNYRDIAKLSSMLPQYLIYQRLSDAAVHTSAASLSKHMTVKADGLRWSYRFWPADNDDITSTLHRAVLAVMPIAIVVTKLLADDSNNAALNPLVDRFQALPIGAMI